MKIAFRFLLFMIMFASIFYLKDSNAFAQTIIKDDVEYNISEQNKTASVSNGKNAEGNIRLESEVNYEGVSYSVVSIDDNAFAGSNVEGVIIPDSIKSIGKRAFEECRNLTAVGMYEGEMRIDDYAFYNSGINDLKLPLGVSYIGENSFSNCYELKNVFIPSTVKVISSNAFSWCTELETVEIENGVQEIKNMAFYHCTKLSSIFIPDSVIMRLGDSAFEWCTNLSSVKLSENITEIGAKAFSRCSSLESIVIPSEVYYIGEKAFDACKNLEFIEIPESVTYVGNMAFGNSEEDEKTKLKKVECVRNSFIDNIEYFDTWEQYGVTYPEFSYKVSEESVSGSIFGEYTATAYISVTILLLIIIFGIVIAYKKRERMEQK